MRRVFLIPGLILTFALPVPATAHAEARCDHDGPVMANIMGIEKDVWIMRESGMPEEDVIERINAFVRPKSGNEADLKIRVTHIIYHFEPEVGYAKLKKICADETAAGTYQAPSFPRVISQPPR
jgi:hypothetical protein